MGRFFIIAIVVLVSISSAGAQTHSESVHTQQLTERLVRAEERQAAALEGILKELRSVRLCKEK